MSVATDTYLKPASNLGDAVLKLTCTQDKDTHEIKHFIAEVYDPYEFDQKLPDDGTGIQKTVKMKGARPPQSWEAQQFLKERFKHGCKQVNRSGAYHPIYEVPITDYTVNLIKHAWTNPKIISEVAQPLFNKIFLREFRAEQNAKRTALYKANGTVPTDKWFDEHDAKLLERGITLNAYQKCASYNACHSKAYAYFCDPGTGKTCMMIRKLDYLIDHQPLDEHGKPVQMIGLITCPKSVRSNWVNEINKFSTNSDKIYIHILSGGDAVQRCISFMQALYEAGDKHFIVICGYEAFVQTPKLHEIEYKFCFKDESHNIANPGTKRTKCFLDARSIFEHKIIATGTPFRNTPFDIFAQLEFLDDGISGFESFQRFKDFYGEYSPPAHYNGKSQLVGYHAERIPLLQEKIAKYAFVIRKEEALPHLPKKTFSISEYNLHKDQLKVYIDLANQLAAEIESYGPEPDAVTVENILTQMLRLAQITSGFVVTDAGTISRFDPNPKLDSLCKLLLGDNDEETVGVLEDTNQKAIVWCCFKENLKMIQSRLALEGIDSVTFHGSTDDKDEMVRRFNCDNDCRVFIGIAASGGVGLNLVGFDPNNPTAYTTNTSDVVFYSSNWSAVNRLQAADRAHRHNTRVPVHITDLICRNSIDEEIYGRVEGKIKMSMSMQDIKRVLTSMIPNVNGS